MIIDGHRPHDPLVSCGGSHRWLRDRYFRQITDRNFRDEDRLFVCDNLASKAKRDFGRYREDTSSTNKTIFDMPSIPRRKIIATSIQLLLTAAYFAKILNTRLLACDVINREFTEKDQKSQYAEQERNTEGTC